MASAHREFRFGPNTLMTSWNQRCRLAPLNRLFCQLLEWILEHIVCSSQRMQLPTKSIKKIVVETKEKLIAEATESFVPKCHLKRISADLNDKNWSEKLVEAGFKPSEPSVWLLEGLLYYLTEDQVISLFQTISTLLTEESTLLASLTTGSLRDNRDIDNLDSKRTVETSGLSQMP
mmetsp:Transcript_8218/g.36656  ORF Transcript_8218/g.36656 Transcript_8218/m.36656 type:complete len:176 (+) Transcript_8218:1184-1711(+)